MPVPPHVEPLTPEAARVHVRVQARDFSLQDEVHALHAGDARAGAVCSLVGLVRGPDVGQGKAAQAGGELCEQPVLWLEHYPGMTESSIEAMGHEAMVRFGALAVRVVHRIGPLRLGEQIVLVATLAAHREAAFSACAYLMDHLKTQAPFWKKEWRDGQASWVQAKRSDDDATARWHM